MYGTVTAALEKRFLIGVCNSSNGGYSSPTAVLKQEGFNPDSLPSNVPDIQLVSLSIAEYLLYESKKVGPGNDTSLIMRIMEHCGCSLGKALRLLCELKCAAAKNYMLDLPEGIPNDIQKSVKERVIEQRSGNTAQDSIQNKCMELNAATARSIENSLSKMYWADFKKYMAELEKRFDESLRAKSSPCSRKADRGMPPTLSSKLLAAKNTLLRSR